MSDTGLAEIRARLERTGYSPWKDDTFALLDAVERLRADLSRLDESHARQAATIARVREVHEPRHIIGHHYKCDACGVAHPCPTIAAIEGTDS